MSDISKEDIPQQVIEAFSELIETHGVNYIICLGELNNKNYYYFEIPEDIDYGFPQVLYLQNGYITHLEGFDALDALNTLL